MTPYPCSYCGEVFKNPEGRGAHRFTCPDGPRAFAPQPSKGLSEGSNPQSDVKSFLAEASEILVERGKTYDQEGGERSMERTVRAFNAISGLSLSEADGWLFMQTLKDVRQWTRDAYHHDSALDGICYSVLKAECLAKS